MGVSQLYSVSLDGSLQEKLVYANPDVDVGGLVRVGRDRHVVGVSYITDTPHSYIFGPGNSAAACLAVEGPAA